MLVRGQHRPLLEERSVPEVDEWRGALRQYGRIYALDGSLEAGRLDEAI